MYQGPIDKQVFELLSHAHPIKSKWSLSLKIVITALVLTAVGVSGTLGYIFWYQPRGKITRLTKSQDADWIFSVEGDTINFPAERRYLWIVVDVPELGLCWPKRPVHYPNQAFGMKFYENNRDNNGKVSIYALSRAYDQKIREWMNFVLNSGAADGLSMLPEEYRVDSIKLL